MSEPTRDPIQDLERFGTGGIVVNPLDPHQVRRLGDQRRTRRNAAIGVVASAALVLGIVIPVSLVAADNDQRVPQPVVTPTSTPTPQPTPAALGLGEIPEDFPLGLGAEDSSGDGGETLGPDASVETQTPELCDTDVIADAPATGRLAFSTSAPEVMNTRELRTFSEESGATAVLEDLRAALEDCTTWPGAVVPLRATTIAADTGQDSVSFSVIEDPPAGAGYAAAGSVYQVTRVGRAVLTLAHHGEVSPTTAPASGKALVTVTKALAAEMCLFTAAGCGGSAPPASTARIYTYPGSGDTRGALIATVADLDLLRGTPDDFKEFIEGLITPKVADNICGGLQNGHRTVVVERLSTAGYATGSIGGCYAIWAERDGSWTEVLGGTDLVGCRNLDQEGIPRSFVDFCANEETGKTDQFGDFGPVSVDGIELRMTADEVRALGGSVAAGTGCRLYYLPGTTPTPYLADGWLSDKGVVSILTHESTYRRSTPEGISLGSTRADVQAAYPDAFFEQHGEGGGYWIVPLPDGARYRFSMGTEPTDTVSGIDLTLKDQNCFE